jgi:hypothetical protein
MNINNPLDGCRWAKTYPLMGHGGPIHIGKSIRFIYIYFFRILHGYVSKTYPTSIDIGYVSKYPIRYGLVSVFHSLQPTKEGATKRSPPCAKALSGGVPLRHGPYTPPVSPWVGGQGSCALVQGCCRSRRKMESREDRERAASCRV